MYLQLINLSTRRVDSLRLLCPDWAKLRERATGFASAARRYERGPGESG